jgi:hypothetical protein
MQVTRLTLEHVFSVRHHGELTAPCNKAKEPERIYEGHYHYPHGILNQHPVDLLTAKNSYQSRPKEQYDW